METALVDAIIKLMQAATPPTTTTTPTPIFQTTAEEIHGKLLTFVDKTLNESAEEKEEAKQPLARTGNKARTKQEQEQINVCDGITKEQNQT
jgi:hypothetical protein